MMSGELEESLNHEQSSKQTKCFRGSGYLGQLWDVYGVGRCKQGGECWYYGDYRLRKIVSELKRDRLLKISTNGGIWPNK